MTWLTLPTLLCAALAQACALAWPFEGWLVQGQAQGWLQCVGLSVLFFFLVRARSWREGFWLGWWFASVWLAGVFWWLHVSMHVYGGLPWLLAALAVVALAGGLGLYYALMAALFVRLGGACAPSQAACVSGWRSLGQAFLFASCWTLAELMRGQWFTGFPWGAVGYAHVDSLLRAYAPWGGVYGLGWVAACVAALLVLSMRCGWMPRLAVMLLLTLPSVWQAGAGQGLSWGVSAGALRVQLLQGNVSQGEKFQPASGIPDALAWYARQIAQARADLVVAPETALPLLPHELPAGYLQGLQQALSRTGGPAAALLGMPLGSYREGYTNSVIGLNSVAAPGGGAAWSYRYDKQHLVPFGEFVPPLFQWFTRMMNIPLGSFSRGGVVQPSFVHAGQRFAPNVCYEDLFGEELARRFVDPAVAPTVMVNLSNIAWFGQTVAVEQHLQISRMRALEMARPMLRATNTGATAVIDHQGHVSKWMPPHVRGVLDAVVEARTGGMTPYAWWAGRWGLWPLWLLCFTFLPWLAVTNLAVFERICWPFGKTDSGKNK